ncbi:MAG: hypothetical protein QM488_12830 [Rhizobiaceae bacterium]
MTAIIAWGSANLMAVGGGVLLLMFAAILWKGISIGTARERSRWVGKEEKVKKHNDKLIKKANGAADSVGSNSGVMSDDGFRRD